MNLREAIQKAEQILDQERIEPTVKYEAPETAPAATALLVAMFDERGQHPRRVREKPEMFQLKSMNFDLLCAILDQAPEPEQASTICSVTFENSEPVVIPSQNCAVRGAGSWERCASELPLIAEFLVRRGEKQLFINTLSKALLKETRLSLA